MKRKVLGIVIISVLFVTAGMLYQQSGIAETGVKEIKNVGNKMCPVCGEKIKERENKPYEYYGKIYNICSLKCLGEFKKNGDKYLSNVERELQGQAQVVTKVIPSVPVEAVTQAPVEAAPIEAVPPEAAPEVAPQEAAPEVAPEAAPEVVPPEAAPEVALEAAPTDMPVEPTETGESHSH